MLCRLLSGLSRFEEKLDPSLNVKKSKQCKLDCLAVEDEENTFHRNVGGSVTQWNGIIYQRLNHQILPCEDLKYCARQAALETV
jgi:hypothetical protein